MSDAPLPHHRPLTARDASPASGAPPDRWMLVLHGIYGAGRNWRSVAQRFVDARPRWGAALVDLRQHGRSRGFPPPHTLETAAGDLERLVAAEGMEARAVLGHSFGGKVALAYAGRTQAPPERVWIVDSTPEVREPGGDAWRMLDVVRGAPGPFRNRLEGIHAVHEAGYPHRVAQWMGTNLERGEDGAYRWRFAPDDMEALLLDFYRTDAWDVVEDPPEGTELHFVKATQSSVLSEEACERIRAAGRATGRVHLHRVEGGHWLNADNPGAVEELLVRET